MKDTDLRSPDASNVPNPAGKNKVYTYWIKIDSQFFVLTQIVLEKYIQQKGLLLQVCAIFKHCLLYQSLLAFIWHVHIYICMFHPDVQPSWLINWTPVDQPAVWMPNPAGPDGGPVVQPCRSSREECILSTSRGIVSLFHLRTKLKERDKQNMWLCYQATIWLSNQLSWCSTAGGACTWHVGTQLTQPWIHSYLTWRVQAWEPKAKKDLFVCLLQMLHHRTLQDYPPTSVAGYFV